MGNLKERKTRIQYFINKEKGTVIAKLSNLREENFCLVRKLFSSDPWLTKNIRITRIINKYPNEVIGKATCASMDKFDIEKGKAIAKNRLLSKVYGIRRRTMIDVEVYIKNIVEKASSLARLYLLKETIYNSNNEDLI